MPIDEKLREALKPSRKDPSRKDPSRKDPSRKDPSRKDPSRKDPSRKDPSRKEPRKSKKLGRLLAVAAKKILLQTVLFEPAGLGSSEQLELLRGKYGLVYTDTSSAESHPPPPEGHSSKDGGDHGCGDGIPVPQKVLFPAERLSLKWQCVQQVGAGLHNLGNTCFLNATLQCLTYTPPLACYLLSKEHSRACEWGVGRCYRAGVGHQEGFCMLCIMQNHVIQAFTNSGNTIKPMSFIRDLKKIAQHLRFGRQEDAHEFLCYTIDAMQKACLSGCIGYTQLCALGH
ncbi:UNVERIFIED_CONTAM: hypothetical protein H355_005005 [Colinus virginianus]|nr:hypothetical protein H355_005005 [Colinus virginianus]